MLGPAHLGVLASLGDARRARGVAAAARRRALDRRRARRARVRSPPGRSATRTGRCCSRCSRDAGVEAVDLGIAPRRRGDHRRAPSTTRSRRATRVITSGGVSVGDYDFVKARARPASGVLAVVAGRDQAGEAARVRDASRGRPVFGLPGNPVSLARELRAVRPAGAAADDGATSDRVPAGRATRLAESRDGTPVRREAAPRPRVAVDVPRRAAYHAGRSGAADEQRAVGRRPPPTASRSCSPTAIGVPEGGRPSTCMRLDSAPTDVIIDGASHSVRPVAGTELNASGANQPVAWLVVGAR